MGAMLVGRKRAYGVWPAKQQVAGHARSRAGSREDCLVVISWVVGLYWVRACSQRPSKEGLEAGGVYSVYSACSALPYVAVCPQMVSEEREDERIAMRGSENVRL